MMNKKNNKGFSLVELIVVVAIMAVLVGILAPAYLKYVENSRISKDETNLDEITHAVEIAITEEDVYASLEASTKVIFDGTGTADATIDDSDDTNATLLNAVTASVGSKTKVTSKKYTGKDIAVTITYDATNETVTVTGAFE